MQTRGGGARVVPLVAVAAVVAVAVGLVALTLRQPDVVMYAPTPPAARDVGRALVGPILYTIDATSPERWRYFAFQRGAVVDDAGATGWDLAFRRYQILANGGQGFAGGGGIVDLGPVRFDEVLTVPASGYHVNEGSPDPRNSAIAGWYRYGFFSHVLSPKPQVWAIRTADGRYAKIEIVSYYCPGARPGCVTFRYVYQGDGSLVVARRGTQAPSGGLLWVAARSGSEKGRSGDPAASCPRSEKASPPPMTPDVAGRVPAPPFLRPAPGCYAAAGAGARRRSSRPKPAIGSA